MKNKKFNIITINNFKNIFVPVLIIIILVYLCIFSLIKIYEYEDSDKYLNDMYGVWFKGENGKEEAENSFKISIKENNTEIDFFLNVGEKLPLFNLLQHNFYSNKNEDKINYSIQYKNSDNKLINYNFSELENVEIFIVDNLENPYIKRIENDYLYINKNGDVFIPDKINYEIYIPNNIDFLTNKSELETCVKEFKKNSYKCENEILE